MPAPPPESEPAMVTAIGGHLRARLRQRRIDDAAQFARRRRRILAPATAPRSPTTPSAPAAITGAALPALMPAMPQIGKPGLRAMQRLDDARHAGDADRRILVVLRGGRHRRRRCRHSRSDRVGAASACAAVLMVSPMIGVGPEQPPRIRRRHVVPADMHAVGSRRRARHRRGR